MSHNIKTSVKDAKYTKMPNDIDVADLPQEIKTTSDHSKKTKSIFNAGSRLTASLKKHLSKFLMDIQFKIKFKMTYKNVINSFKKNQDKKFYA